MKIEDENKLTKRIKKDNLEIYAYHVMFYIGEGRGFVAMNP